MRKKLFLRQSTGKDIQKILDFFDKNDHEYIAARDHDTMEARINEGAVTTLEDENGNIKAISFAYPVVTTDDNGDPTHKWTEIGTTHVLMGGMGLFDVLVGAQMLNAFLLSPPEERFVIEIKKTNKHSIHVFRKLGCEDFDAPEDMLKIVNGTLAPEYIGGVDWFHCGAELMPELAEKFLNLVNNPIITNKKTGEEFELDVSDSPLGKHFLPVLEELAKQNYGQTQKPDLKQRLIDAQKKLINNRK